LAYARRFSNQGRRNSTTGTFGSRSHLFLLCAFLCFHPHIIPDTLFVSFFKRVSSFSRVQAFSTLRTRDLSYLIPRNLLEFPGGVLAVKQQEIFFLGGGGGGFWGVWGAGFWWRLGVVVVVFWCLVLFFWVFFLWGGGGGGLFVGGECFVGGRGGYARLLCSYRAPSFRPTGSLFLTLFPFYSLALFLFFSSLRRSHRPFFSGRNPFFLRGKGRTEVPPAQPRSLYA